jgi:hypothetical protein
MAREKEKDCETWGWKEGGGMVFRDMELQNERQ